MLSIEDITEILSTEIIGVVPEDENILSSSNRGTPVAYNGTSPAARAYQDIARRLLGEQVPLETGNKESFLDSLRSLFKRN